MILHLHTDSRFANYTIEAFGPALNHHLVGIRYPGQALKYVDRQRHVSTYVFGWSSRKILKKLNPTMIVVHFMDIRWYEVLSLIPDEITVVWVFWGGDGYSLSKMKEQLYDAKTNGASNERNATSKLDKLKADLNVKSMLSIPFLAGLMFEAIRKSKNRFPVEKTKEMLFERVDYCGTFLREDYDLLQSKYTFPMQWMDARFISLNRLIGSLDTYQLGNNILLGNSCTLENNHVDAIHVIKTLKLEADQKVITPLSYGKDLGNYRKWVIDQGRACLSTAFEPLTELMPLDAYTEVLSSCGFAIMYHNRQQAFNNILALVYLGVKVYLKPCNTIFGYLKRIGCQVFSTEELGEVKELTRLSEELVQHNRICLKKEFSAEKILESVRAIEAKATEKAN